MKVLVTGSEGYIGVHLCQMLLAEGYEVIGLDTGFYRGSWFNNGISKIPQTISKDTREVSIEDLKGFDAIIHLAELSNDPLGELDPKATFQVNHIGTVNLIERAKSAKVARFVYFSSCSVYGASDGISNENSKTNPLTEYAKCKILNEKALQKAANKNFTPVILRNATAFGVSPRMRFDLVVNNLTGIAWTAKHIKMESDGSPWRPLVHVRDICRAAIAALIAPKGTVYNQIFNVGSNQSNYQIKDIAREISKIFSGCKITFNKNGKDKRNYRVSFNKINTKLPGFKCKIILKDGIGELFDTYKKINLTTQMFESKEYTHLKQVNYLRETGQLDNKFLWKRGKK